MDSTFHFHIYSSHNFHTTQPNNFSSTQAFTIHSEFKHLSFIHTLNTSHTQFIHESVKTASCTTRRTHSARLASGQTTEPTQRCNHPQSMCRRTHGTYGRGPETRYPGTDPPCLESCRNDGCPPHLKAGRKTKFTPEAGRKTRIGGETWPSGQRGALASQRS
jgi:hypothetical protein